MSAPRLEDYRVQVHRRAAFTEHGQIDSYSEETELYSETTTIDWAHCLTVVRVMARAEPDMVVSAYNPTLAEEDTDGLTDEQREAVFEAVEEARRALTSGPIDTLIAAWREEEELARRSGLSPRFTRSDAIRGLVDAWHAVRRGETP